MGLKKHIIYVGLVALCAMSVSCKKEDCLKGNEFVQKHERNVDDFTAVSANLSAQVELVPDTSFKTPFVEIIAESNVAEHISTVVNNGELQISLGFCFEQHKDIRLIVHYDSLNTITVKGPTDISSSLLMRQKELTLINQSSGTINVNVHAQDLHTEINGSGHVYINGQVQNHYSQISGSGKLHGYNCYVTHHQTKTTGSGYTYTRAMFTLDAQISGSGNIYYKGFPQITDTITGSGQLINAN